MLEELSRLSHRFLEIKNFYYRRYLLTSLPKMHRLTVIVGQRGVGKTTVLIQTLLDLVQGDRFDPRILYIQADHFLTGSLPLYEIAEQFQSLGGKWIVFDEIHKYPEWSKELKSIYDTFPDLQVFASGSSALQIYKGSHDLTRRAAVYQMQGMSFREYLELNTQIDLPAYTLEQICKNHEQISASIIQKLRALDKHVLAEFLRYLQIGYYPYFHELKDELLYKMTLEQNIHATIESDLAAIYPQLTGASIHKIKKLLSFIAQAVPFIPNWNKIKEAVEVGDLRTLKTYFSHLQDAGLIRSLSKATQKFTQLESPAKIYLENPNQLYAISSITPEKGTVRETFFVNMVSQKHTIQIPGDGDFLVDNHYLFEVGGKNKTFRQLQGALNGYIACDEIEQGIARKIPLWLFGFLY